MRNILLQLLRPQCVSFWYLAGVPLSLGLYGKFYIHIIFRVLCVVNVYHFHSIPKIDILCHEEFISFRGLLCGALSIGMSYGAPSDRDLGLVPRVPLG